MKRLLLISIGFWLCSLGFAQNQEKTDTIHSIAKITILPSTEAKLGEIYCYCIEYYSYNECRNKAAWKYFYVLPAVSPKGKYIKTHCELTDLRPNTHYAFRVFALYWGFAGEYGLSYWPGFKTSESGGEISIELQCGPTVISPLSVIDHSIKTMIPLNWKFPERTLYRLKEEREHLT